jgi:hypothetical protein
VAINSASEHMLCAAAEDPREKLDEVRGIVDIDVD